jgi:DNA-binding NarL/FixJ family response regulator
MITVLVVDDHPLVRSGLAGLLGPTDDMDVSEASGGVMAVAVARELHPDVILMDLSMPDMDGVEATRRILEEQPGTSVVVLTSFADQARVAEALAAGAVGYLLKDCEPRDVLAAVRSAALGHAPIDPRVARALLPAASAFTGRSLSAIARSRCCGCSPRGWRTSRSAGLSGSPSVRSRSTSAACSAGSASRTGSAPRCGPATTCPSRGPAEHPGSPRRPAYGVPGRHRAAP